MLRALIQVADQADDVLLVYYVGHGVLNADGDLHLATQATVDLTRGMASYEALPYREVVQAMLDVPEVELDPLGPRQRRPAVDLGPAGDPRLDVKPATLALGVLLDLHRQCRPRADDRHLAAHDVPEVRELVERVAAQEVAEPRDPGISFGDRQAGAGELGAVRPSSAACRSRTAVRRGPRASGCRSDGRATRAGSQRRARRRPGPSSSTHATENNVQDPHITIRHRVPSAGSHPAAVPCTSQSHSPAASDAVVST